MSNCIIAFPNQVDATYYTVRLVGGDWSLPLSNLKSSLLSDVARSASVDEEDTRFHVDTGVSRLCKVWAIPFINGDRTCQYRIRATSVIKWSGVTVNGSHSTSDTTILVDNAIDLDIEDGDYLTINGVEYKATANLSILAGVGGTLNITPGLAGSVSDDTPVVCIVGDYTAPEVDTGVQDYVKRIYPMGSLPFGHESFWDGKPTDEVLSELKIPIIHIEETAQVVRYHLVEIFNDDNEDNFIDVPRLVIAPGWQPSINMDYGAQMGWATKTQMGESLGGARYYDRREPRRSTRFTISYLDENEALVQAFEAQRTLGIDRQLFFVWDPDDTDNLSRQSFLATMRGLSALEFPVFEHATAAFELEEVI